MRVLVVDVGGTNVKLKSSDAPAARYFDSPPALTPDVLVTRVRQATSDWTYEVVSIGYPGRVGREGPATDPGNLGPGWVNFEFESAFGMPVRVVNDAVMQALGGYDGGRMLFLGLGTGLGFGARVRARRRAAGTWQSARCVRGHARRCDWREGTRIAEGTVNGSRWWTEIGRRPAQRTCRRLRRCSAEATPTESIRCRRTPAAAATRTRSKAVSAYGRSWSSRTTVSRLRSGASFDEVTARWRPITTARSRVMAGSTTTRLTRFRVCDQRGCR